MMDGNVDKIERVLELRFDNGDKKQFRVNDIVDVNYRCDDIRFLHSLSTGTTGRIACICDDTIHIDSGTLFNSNIDVIKIGSIAYIEKADPEHIEDKRRL